ncbi:hypothetical protein [Parasphingopyxis lamellibrachiae]|uniref:hypothetical protein n=1 Tax=Parasphingopyxis lamellibrachiae TaxID=680125 RepID=UPI000E268BF4|nr:hypothetical protein [Parasphingopyxis lamellibrachiae]
MDEKFVVAAIALIAIAVFAGLMDRRRNNRDHLDEVGWANWPLIMILALIGATMLAIAGAKL